MNWNEMKTEDKMKWMAIAYTAIPEKERNPFHKIIIATARGMKLW